MSSDAERLAIMDAKMIVRRDPMGFTAASSKRRIDIAEDLLKTARSLVNRARSDAEAADLAARRRPNDPPIRIDNFVLATDAAKLFDRVREEEEQAWRSWVEFMLTGLIEGGVATLREDNAKLREDNTRLREDNYRILEKLDLILQRQADLPNGMAKLFAQYGPRAPQVPAEDFKLEPERPKVSTSDRDSRNTTFGKKHPLWPKARGAAIAAVADYPLSPSAIARRIKEQVPEFEVPSKSIPNRLVAMGFYRVRPKLDRNQTKKGSKLFFFHETLPGGYARV